MGFRDMIDRVTGRKERFSELSEEDKLQNMVVERKKSSNERELERFLEEDRQKAIKGELERRRKQQLHETFTDNSILNAPNIFNHKQTILNNDKSILDNNNQMLNKGTLFFK